jgi:hypothetical protein
MSIVPAQQPAFEACSAEGSAPCTDFIEDSSQGGRSPSLDSARRLPVRTTPRVTSLNQVPSSKRSQPCAGVDGAVRHG